MHRYLKLALLLVAAVFISACNEENKEMIRFVNMDKAISDSGLQAQELAHLTLVKRALEQGGAEAESRYQTLDKAKVESARQSDAQILQIQWQQQQQAARNVVLATVQQEAAAMMKAEKISAILPVQSALAVDSSVDVTPALIAKLKDKKLIFAAVPEITFKEDDAKAPAAESPKGKKP